MNNSQMFARAANVLVWAFLLNGHVMAMDAPWQPDVANRPSLVLTTDSYVYGAATGYGTEPVLRLSLTRNDYTEPVTHYLIWQNRETGETRSFTRENGMVPGVAPLLGSVDNPEAKRLPDAYDVDLLASAADSGAPMPGDLPQQPGHYLWLYQLRDPSGKVVIAQDAALYSFVADQVTVQEAITEDTTFTADQTYYLAKPIRVISPATLTIEPGVVVTASFNNEGALFVQQGAKLIADGTRLLPIVMTSEKPQGERRPGDWGGLAINGFAPVNKPNAIGEGDSGPYGGNDPADNSGTLRYVRIEYAGIIYSLANELNGLALQGVGDGTTIEHVQIHRAADDGIEFFGGSVNARHVLVTACQDDSLDWTSGYVGKLQHIALIQYGDEADRGIEADNNSRDNDALPRSHPVIYNLSGIGMAMTNYEQSRPEYGAMLRRGTAGELYNSLLCGFGHLSIGLRHEATIDQLEEGSLRIDHCLFYRNALNATGTQEPNVEWLAEILTRKANNQFTNPQFSAINALKPDITPLSTSPAGQANRAKVPDDGFFIPASYLGAVEPGTNEIPWTLDIWTNYAID